MTTDRNAPSYDEVENLIDLRSVWVGLRRRAGLFAAVAATVFSAVAAYAFLTTELYTAETSIMIEPKTQVFAYGQDVFPQVAADPKLVDTEVELLRSRAMADRVSRRMGEFNSGALVADGQANTYPTSANFFEKRLSDVAADFANLQSNIRPGPSVGAESSSEQSSTATENATADEPQLRDVSFDQTGAATPDTANISDGLAASSVELAAKAPLALDVDKMLSRLEIQRVGTTFLVKIRYSSPSSEESAIVANAYAEEYILEQLEAQYSDLRQANQWIDARLSVLREEVRTAEEAAAMFRAEQGLVEAKGSSFSEQAMSGIAAELAAARTNLASLRARYNTVRALVSSNASIDSISEVMSSPMVAELRRQQTEINRTRAELNVRYGDRHPELKKINEEAAELDSQLDREVRRIVDSLRAEVSFAGAQVSSLERSMTEAQGDLVSNNTAAVELQELERDTEATRGVYEALLNRQKELNERDQLADANARIIARAEPPATPSKPRRKLVLAGGVMLAFLVAGISSFAAEALDNRIRNTSDIRREFGSAAPVVLIPRIQSRLLFRQRQSDDVARKYIVEENDSVFADALRDLRMHLKAAERGIEGAVSVAFTSVFKGEGKSTTAFSFASLLAQSGKRVAFIDCAIAPHDFVDSDHQLTDMRETAGQPQLLESHRQSDGPHAVSDGDDASIDIDIDVEQPQTEAAIDQISNMRDRQLTAHSEAGALEVYDIRPKEKRCGVIMLEFDGGANPFDDFDMNAFDRSLESVSDEFDYIIVDAPAVLNKPEASVIAAAADFSVVVTEWCMTTRDAAAAAVQRLMDARARILSFAITKVDEKQRFYFRPEDRNFYFKKPT
ncbi:MAG: exopolysaccharide transport family protein [Pseudomonadota bacterium]